MVSLRKKRKPLEGGNGEDARVKWGGVSGFESYFAGQFSFTEGEPRS